MGSGEYDFDCSRALRCEFLEEDKMIESAVLFYLLGGIAIISALGVISIGSPVYAAFSLVITMVSVAGLFWTLDAVFVAAVQLAVYAGAVVVLFVMVMMLIDLKSEKHTFNKGVFGGFAKLTSLGLLFGITCHVIYYYSASGVSLAEKKEFTEIDVTRELSQLLFSKYIFGFEAISILLLMVAVGAVALSRIKGGTHAQSK